MLAIMQNLASQFTQDKEARDRQMQGLSNQMSQNNTVILDLTQGKAAQDRQMQNMDMQIKQIAGEVNMMKGQRDNKLPSQ